MTKRQQLINLYERNMNLVFNFRNDYKDYLSKTNNWNQPSFPDSNITHKQYFDEFEKVSKKEYSDDQYNAIKTVEIPESLLDQYIAGINQQYESLSLIYEDLKRKSN